MPVRNKLLVFGGSGFVGGAVARAALEKGLDVVCLSRSGAPHPGWLARSAEERRWVDAVSWEHADGLDRLSVQDALAAHGPQSVGVVSTIGVLTLNRKHAVQTNGDVNANIAAAIYKSPAVPKLVYVSAAHMWPLHWGPLKGYFEGKLRAERAILSTLGDRAAILRPGMVHGYRLIGSRGAALPLSALAAPVSLVTRPLYALTGAGLFSPPVAVEDVGAAAVEMALRPSPTAEAAMLELERLAAEEAAAAAEAEAAAARAREEQEAARREAGTVVAAPPAARRSLLRPDGSVDIEAVMADQPTPQELAAMTVDLPPRRIGSGLTVGSPRPAAVGSRRVVRGAMGPPEGPTVVLEFPDILAAAEAFEARPPVAGREPEEPVAADDDAASEAPASAAATECRKSQP